MCRGKGIPFTFLTNNSSKSAEAYLQKLRALGVKVSPKEMFTSGDATLLYLAQNGYGKNILLVGTESLERQFLEAGYVLNTENPAAVVLGFDTTLTYQKLTALCNAVRAGLPYVATHPDFNCPVEGGYIPDIGAVIAFVEASTGRRPDVVVGKPNGTIAMAAASRFGVPLESLCMV
ncbi:MAG: HAD-IIA family hydrolase, partial [Oscillospiraceae bacterium]